MKQIYLNIAGFNIKLNFRPTEWQFLRNKFIAEIKKYYRGFITEKRSARIDFTIDVIERKFLNILIKSKKRRAYIGFYENISSKKIATFYQISLIQFQTIIRTILTRLLGQHNGFILHASAVKVDGGTYIFLGRNGAGKSTAMKLLNDRFPSLADDTIIIRKENKQFYLYQTPFIEKEAWVKKELNGYPIKKIFFLRKSDDFKIEKINNKDYHLDRIIKQFWSEGDNYKKQVKYILGFVSAFEEFYFLYFAKDKERLIKLIENV